MRILIRITVLFGLLIVFFILNGDSFAARGWLLQTLCDDPRLYCIVVHKGETWQSLFPDPARRQLVMRINRMNTRIWPGMRIAVPRDPQATNTNSLHYTPFPSYRSPTGRKMIVYSPALNAWAAYGPSGNIIHWGAASGGQNWCPDLGRPCHTPSGIFRIYEKRGADCYSSKFPKPDGGAPMPYCMFFKGGFAMHGSAGVPGFNASHGCIRMFTDDARWLSHEFAGVGTSVIVLPYPITHEKQRMRSQEVVEDNDDDDDDDDGVDVAQIELGPITIG